MSGLIQVYTGNGKGKTTAALGLALRAAGAGKKIYIAQFVKGMYYSELSSVKQISAIEIHQFGLDCFIEKEPTQNDIDAAQKGFSEVKTIMAANKHQVLILDEIFIAIFFKLIDKEEVIKLIKQKPSEMELVLTGRYAPTEICDIADLVTEMVEIEHYYKKGIQARKGIEF
ncbi:MAG TPA: cob(I)yrinic acid a,c-diamide adenosyltransferase [Tenuifilaceae bacterium]|nr:cob(I)yrinic acid a,c-diamide adenosyltransferase [Tenuifilaceae bacterium]